MKLWFKRKLVPHDFVFCCCWCCCCRCCWCCGCSNFYLPPGTCTINYILIGPVRLVCVCVCGNLFTIFTLILLTDSAKRNEYKTAHIVQWKQLCDGQHPTCQRITHALCSTLCFISVFLHTSVCGCVWEFECVRMFKYSLQIPIAFALKLAMPTTTTTRAGSSCCLFFFFCAPFLLCIASAVGQTQFGRNAWPFVVLNVCQLNIHSLLKRISFAKEQMSD